MRVTETYFQKKVNTQSNQKNEEDMYADFYEETTRERSIRDINIQESVFQEHVFQGINTEQNIFDKTALFHTER